MALPGRSYRVPHPTQSVTPPLPPVRPLSGPGNTVRMKPRACACAAELRAGKQQGRQCRLTPREALAICPHGPLRSSACRGRWGTCEDRCTTWDRPFEPSNPERVNIHLCTECKAAAQPPRTGTCGQHPLRSNSGLLVTSVATHPPSPCPHHTSTPGGVCPPGFLPALSMVQAQVPREGPNQVTLLPKPPSGFMSPQAQVQSAGRLGPLDVPLPPLQPFRPCTPGAQPCSPPVTDCHRAPTRHAPALLCVLVRQQAKAAKWSLGLGQPFLPDSPTCLPDGLHQTTCRSRLNSLPGKLLLN